MLNEKIQPASKRCSTAIPLVLRDTNIHEAATVAPIIAQYDRIVTIAEAPTTPAQILAEFATAGHAVPSVSTGDPAPERETRDDNATRIIEIEAEIKALTAMLREEEPTVGDVFQGLIDRAAVENRLSRAEPDADAHLASAPPRPWELDPDRSES